MQLVVGWYNELDERLARTSAKGDIVVGRKTCHHLKMQDERGAKGELARNFHTPPAPCGGPKQGQAHQCQRAGLRHCTSAGLSEER